MHLHHRRNEVCASKMHWTCCAGADQLTITLNISWAYWTHCVRDVHSKAIASGRCQSAVRVQCVSSGYVGNLIFLPYLEGNSSACNSRTWEWSKKKKKIMGFFSCHAFIELLLFVNSLFSVCSWYPNQQKLFYIRKTSHICIYVSTYITTHIYIYICTHISGEIYDGTPPSGLNFVSQKQCNWGDFIPRQSSPLLQERTRTVESVSWRNFLFHSNILATSGSQNQTLPG